MAKWKVEMCATIQPVWLDVYVEADSKEEAMEKGREHASTLSSACWETGDGTVEDIQADSAEEVPA